METKKLYAEESYENCVANAIMQNQLDNVRYWFKHGGYDPFATTTDGTYMPVIIADATEEMQELHYNLTVRLIKEQFNIYQNGRSNPNWEPNFTKPFFSNWDENSNEYIQAVRGELVNWKNFLQRYNEENHIERNMDLLTNIIHFIDKIDQLAGDFELVDFFN